MDFKGIFLNSPESGLNIPSGLLSRIARVHYFDRVPLSKRCHRPANRAFRSSVRKASRAEDSQLRRMVAAAPLSRLAKWRNRSKSSSS